jgi:hypothetical protein
VALVEGEKLLIWPEETPTVEVVKEEIHDPSA